MLIDQGRTPESGGKYKTRNDRVHENDMTFEGGACAGGICDTKTDNENFTIITDGNNRFDANIYRVPRTGESAYPWGHEILDWDGLRARGLEPSGRLVRY